MNADPVRGCVPTRTMRVRLCAVRDCAPTRTMNVRLCAVRDCAPTRTMNVRLCAVRDCAPTRTMNVQLCAWDFARRTRGIGAQKVPKMAAHIRLACLSSQWPSMCGTSMCWAAVVRRAPRPARVRCRPCLRHRQSAFASPHPRSYQQARQRCSRCPAPYPGDSGPGPADRPGRRSGS